MTTLTTTDLRVAITFKSGNSRSYEASSCHWMGSPAIKLEDTDKNECFYFTSDRMSYSSKDWLEYLTEGHTIEVTADCEPWIELTPDEFKAELHRTAAAVFELEEQSELAA